MADRRSSATVTVLPGWPEVTVVYDPVLARDSTLLPPEQLLHFRPLWIKQSSIFR